MARRWLPAAAVTLLAAALAWLNRGERVALDLGFATFYRAPLTVVLFLAFLAGMLAMLWLGLRQDRRMREELRARGIVDLPPRRTPAPAPQPAAPAWTQPEEPAVRAEAAPPAAASAWSRADETVVRDEASSSPAAERPAASAWTRPDETVVRNDEFPPPAASPWAQDETVVRDEAPSSPAAWTQADETVVRSEPPAEERTIIRPRYDEDPAT